MLAEATLASALGIPPAPIHNKIYLRHRQWMMRAMALADAAGKLGEVPVAAIAVGPDNQIIAQATNRKEQECDPTAHAEVLALRAAGKQLGNWHLNDCTLYVTLEPCVMCAGAIIQSRLGRLVYGADDPKAGAVRTVLNIPDGPCSNHRLQVTGGILAAPCRQQLQHWFQQRRQQQRAN
ncbi:MAG: tRNA adenosine(34) deaminase TadA [Phormidesmis sp. RL_2_1]|nr:tRNA adenosine(34) deaminase TadA [Phormidesmis sp. RL_2_1]